MRMHVYVLAYNNIVRACMFMYPYVGICLGMKVCIRAYNTSGI